MKHLAVRLHLLAATVLTYWGASAHALDEKLLAVNIQRQPVLPALKQLGEQTGLQLLWRVNSAPSEGILVQPVTGQFSVRVALDRLLANTGLTYEFINDRTVRIYWLSTRPSSWTAEPGSNAVPNAIRVAEVGRIAATVAASDGSSPQESSEGSFSGGRIEEVLVSAQKRVERLQDVPVPVTAISADVLQNSNQPRVRDYYARIPGLNLTDTGIYGGSVISIRGITSGLLNGNTATVVIDDVPYGISSNPGGPTSVVPEIDPNDLARLEVLRGPQGTLYGASSMGGLLKYVTIEPSTEQVTGQVNGGVSSVHNGNGAGYNLGGAINVPVGDVFAVRMSGFTRRDPGYIDDPVHTIDGVNWGEVDGGRVAGLWQPSHDFSLKLTAMYQDSKAAGNTYFGPTVGFGTLRDLQQVAPPGTGGYHKTLQVYTANAAAHLGSLELVSISAYSLNRADYLFDLTSVALYKNLALSQFGVGGADTRSNGSTKRFTQELRFTLPLGERADWLFGGFYADERNPRINYYLALNPDTGQVAGAPGAPATLGTLDFPSTYNEKSAFTDLTYRFTDRFDVQLGGRLAYSTQALPHYASTGFLGTVNQGRVESKDHSFTYLLTPRLKLSTNLMTYARLASGYRPGGPNLPSTLSDPSVPRAYAPDKTQNFEIGTKGNVLDHALTFDASVYYIEWSDIQLQGLISPATRINYKANGGNAKSEGVDLSLDIRPWDGLTVSATGAWNLAALTQSFPAITSVRGSDGDRLPFSSRFSGSVSVDQAFPLGSLQGFVGVSESFVGDRKGPFVGGTTPRADLPEYFNTDLHAGVRWTSWDATLYANNITDRRGLLMGGAGSFIPNIYTYTRPRVIGVNLSTKF